MKALFINLIFKELLLFVGNEKQSRKLSFHYFVLSLAEIGKMETCLVDFQGLPDYGTLNLKWLPLKIKFLL